MTRTLSIDQKARRRYALGRRALRRFFGVNEAQAMSEAYKGCFSHDAVMIFERTEKTGRILRVELWVCSTHVDVFSYLDEEKGCWGGGSRLFTIDDERLVCDDLLAERRNFAEWLKEQTAA